MKILSIFALIGILLSASAVPTAAQSGGAEGSVRAVLDKAMEIQTRPDLEGEAHRAQRAGMIRKLISENFLSAEMARESVKGHWDKVPQNRRSEFQDLFIGLFQDSYTRMVLNFLQKENIEYRSESSEGGSKVVKTVIMRANEHIPVDYYLDRKNNRWLIRDVSIDGVSIVENYNIQFARVIQKEGFDGLMKKMRTQRQAIGSGA